MEIFYPQNRFLNFYVAPLSLEKRSRRNSRETAENAGGSGGQDLIGYAIILRDITETRRTTEETIEVGAAFGADAAGRRSGA